MNPLVSVIIPVKDRPEILARAINSILNQTYNNIEIVVVENNSLDKESIQKVIQRFNGENIVLSSMDKCANANVARNYGIDISSGCYIAMLDSDDEFKPEHISNCLKTLLEHNADFIYGSITISNGSDVTLKKARPLSENESGIEYLFGENSSWAQTSTYFGRSDVMRLVKWDEDLFRHQDYDFFIRMCDSHKCAVNELATVIFNIDPNGKRAYNSHSMRSFYFKWRNRMNLIHRAAYSKDKFRKAIKNYDLYNLGYFLGVFMYARLCYLTRKLR